MVRRAGSSAFLVICSTAYKIIVLACGRGQWGVDTNTSDTWPLPSWDLHVSSKGNTENLQARQTQQLFHFKLWDCSQTKSEMCSTSSHPRSTSSTREGPTKESSQDWRPSPRILESSSDTECERKEEEDSKWGLSRDQGRTHSEDDI